MKTPDGVEIAERWAEVHRQCVEFLEHPGEPSTKPVEWCVQIIEELSQAEALNRKQANKLLDANIAWADKCEEVGRLKAENARLREENKVLGYALRHTVQEREDLWCGEGAGAFVTKAVEFELEFARAALNLTKEASDGDND